MTDIKRSPAAGEIRTVELRRDITAFPARRPPRSIVPHTGGTAISPTAPSGITVDNGLILATYSNPLDATPRDSVSNKGGPLILQAHLELVFWGAAWQSASGPGLDDVVGAINTILGSPYLLGLAQYGFQSAAVRGTTIVPSPAPPATYSLDDAENLIWSLIDDGEFPQPDNDGGRILYMVFMPPGTTPPSDARGAHGDPSDDRFPVDYAWVGFVSYGTLDYITDVFSHEFVETITDPEHHDPGWLMNRIINKGDEIGDACNNTVDYLDGVMVQAYWSERQKACVIPQARGALSRLTSLELGVKVESGGTGEAYVSLDNATPIGITLSLASDNPAVLTVPATLAIPAGAIGGLVPLTAEPVVGPYQFVAIHASYNGTTVTGQVEVTPRPSVIGGVVTAAASHWPLAQAVVVIDNGAMDGSGHWQLLTGKNGSYATGTVTPGTYTIEVTASGYVPGEATVVVQEGVPTVAANVALVASLPSTITGTVQDAHGTPVAGAAVLLLQQDRNQQLTTVTSGRGVYSLTVNPAYYTGGYWLQVTAPGYATGFLSLVIPNGSSLQENFVLAPLGSLTGVLTDAGQTPPAPVAGAGVQAALATSDPLIPGTATATTDATGRYQLQLPPGPTAITVAAGGFETWTGTVTVVPGGAVTQDIGLVRASAGLDCTVSAAGSGRPIINAYVSVVGGQAGPLTHNGSYTVVRIPAGERVISVHAEGFKPLQWTFPFTAHQTMSMDLTLDSVQPGPPPDPHPPM